MKPHISTQEWPRYEASTILLPIIWYYNPYEVNEHIVGDTWPHGVLKGENWDSYIVSLQVERQCVHAGGLPWRMSWETAQAFSAYVFSSLIPLESAASQYRLKAPTPPQNPHTTSKIPKTVKFRNTTETVRQTSEEDQSAWIVLFLTLTLKEYSSFHNLNTLEINVAYTEVVLPKYSLKQASHGANSQGDKESFRVDAETREGRVWPMHELLHHPWHSLFTYKKCHPKRHENTTMGCPNLVEI